MKKRKSVSHSRIGHLCDTSDRLITVIYHLDGDVSSGKAISPEHVKGVLEMKREIDAAFDDVLRRIKVHGSESE